LKLRECGIVERAASDETGGFFARKCAIDREQCLGNTKRLRAITGKSFVLYERKYAIVRSLSLESDSFLLKNKAGSGQPLV